MPCINFLNTSLRVKRPIRHNRFVCNSKLNFLSC